MIFVEGKPDRTLLIAIGLSKKEVTIAGSKGNVCNRLKEKSDVKGVVDEDPESAQPGYIKGLTKKSEDCNLICYYDRIKQNTLIVIKPDLEKWVISWAKRHKIDTKKYYLPDNSKELKKNINQRLDKFEKFIDSNDKVDALVKLKEYINS